MMSRAFEIVESYTVENFVVVRGRAWRKISVGDTLWLLDNADVKVAKFSVAWIYSYGFAHNALDAVLTGDLGLTGTHMKALNPGYLCFCEESSASI